LGYVDGKSTRCLESTAQGTVMDVAFIDVVIVGLVTALERVCYSRERLEFLDQYRFSLESKREYRNRRDGRK
jgi:hypothetical protein